jgi:hypothetical protein
MKIVKKEGIHKIKRLSLVIKTTITMVIHSKILIMEEDSHHRVQLGWITLIMYFKLNNKWMYHNLLGTTNSHNIL